MQPEDAQRLQRIEEKVDDLTDNLRSITTHVFGDFGQGGLTRAFHEHQMQDQIFFESSRKDRQEIKERLTTVQEDVHTIQRAWKWVLMIASGTGVLLHLIIDWIHKSKP